MGSNIINAALLFIVLLGLIDVVLTVLAFRERSAKNQLTAAGIYTTATITRRRHDQSASSKSGATDTYFVVYEFKDSANRTRTVEQEINQSQYDAFVLGQAVQVRYLPSDPQLARIRGTESKKLNGLIIGTGFSYLMTLVLIVAVLTIGPL
jgi:hypothetical protein